VNPGSGLADLAEESIEYDDNGKVGD